MKLTVLGNCATETLEHETTSFVISNGDKHLLIDCGPAVVYQLLKTKIQPKDISAVVLTHSHGDHVAGYPYFLFMVNVGRVMSKTTDAKKIPVIALKSVMEAVTEMVSIQYPVEQLHECLVDVHEIQEGSIEPIVAESFAIYPFLTEHIIPTIGLTVKCGNSAITFSGDTKYTPIVEQMAVGSSILVHEAFCTEQFIDLAHSSGHSTGREAGISARNSGVKKLILSHLLDFIWSNSKTIIDEASSEFNGEIFLPSEFDSIEI